MDRLIVACVQQRMRLPQTIDDYEADLQRFMRAATNKNARLVIFPELAGIMAFPPMLIDFRSTLLKRADLGRRKKATWWQRFSGSMAGNLASFLEADLRQGVSGLLDTVSEEMWESYVEIFGGLARSFGVTIVAPSAYLPDPLDGVIRNLSVIFGPNGEPLGIQSKVMLHPEDEDIAQAGSTWDVVETEVGRIGLMLGSDVLYPEVGRLLAYQDAEILIAQGACPNPALYNKVRSGMLARMQDNQLFGVVSFLVGHNELSKEQRKPFMGKSAIFAPQELTPRFNGVLVEMGNHRSEGVITAEWDFVALKELWETSDTPVRQLSLPQTNLILTQLYENIQRLPHPLTEVETEALEVTETEFDDADGELDGLLVERPPTDTSEEVHELDDLPILSSVTTLWPIPGSEGEIKAQSEPKGKVAGEKGLNLEKSQPVKETLSEAESSTVPNRKTSPEDETDEMDALS